MSKRYLYAGIAVTLGLTAPATTALGAGPSSQDPNQPEIGLKISGTAVRQIPIVILPL